MLVLRVVLLVVISLIAYVELLPLEENENNSLEINEDVEEMNIKRRLSWADFLAARKAEKDKAEALRKAQEAAIAAANAVGGTQSDDTKINIDRCRTEWFDKYKVNSNDECWLATKTSEILKAELQKNVNKIASSVEQIKWENEYGRYKQRKETKIIDVINAINNALDYDGSDAIPIDENEIHNYENGHGRKRDVRRERIYLWIDRHVPYELDTAFGGSQEQKVVYDAMKDIEEQTCIKFVPFNGQHHNWIKFVRKNGCYSKVGRTFWSQGYQEISLGSNCLYKGIVMHEILHALGFYHEQSRNDRDKYVEIFWENIAKGRENNFAKQSVDTAELLGEPYDFDSIMHYGKFSFALNTSAPTILSIANPSQPLGQREKLSQTDIRQLNKLYDCKNTGTGWSNWSDFGRCAKNNGNACNKERSRFCMNPTDKTSCPNPVDKSEFSSTKWGIDTDIQTCTQAECNAPLDGHWNKWGSWGACSATCDQGTKTRTRKCTDPEPKNGGADCVGSNTHSTSCQKRGCDEGPNDCTFDLNEEPYCKWNLDTTKNPVAKQMQWLRSNKGTPSGGTGPDKDHTSGNGYFIYIESSSPAGNNHKARLSSPTINSGSKCMKFAYSMYGPAIGTLNVIIKDLATGVETNVFTETGDQLKGWKEHETLIKSTNQFKIIIEAIRAGSFQGDIGIDDIVIKDGACGDGDQGNIKPSSEYSSIGCYHDYGYINGKRPFNQVKNFRNFIKWDTWDKIDQSLNGIVKDCAAFAKANNYKLFAVENYGECWTGNDNNYSRDGESTDCFTATPDGQGNFVVGREFSLFAYKFND